MTTVTNKKTEIPTTTTKFIEIVNWQKAQCMTKSDAPWLKLYTSILDNDRIDLLDDASYRLLNGLWALAARMGIHIFPADPGWLMRRIPFLKKEPDLTPLLEAKDIYGRAAPFIRYCKPPTEQSNENGETVKSKDNESKTKKHLKGKDPFYDKSCAIVLESGYASARALQNILNISYNRASKIVKSMVQEGLVGDYIYGKGCQLKHALEKTEKKKEEKSREEKSTETLTDFGREKGEEINKAGLNPVSEKDQSIAEQNPSRAQTKQNIAEHIPTSQDRPQNPSNPMESEAAAVSSHFVPKQPSSAYRGRNIVHIGDVIAGRFPEHWLDRDCEAFGWQIVEALGYQPDAENMEVRSEWGAFASWWARVKQAAPSVADEELKAVAIAKAEYIRTKAKSARNKSAVWFKIMQGVLESRGISLQPARASPAM